MNALLPILADVTMSTGGLGQGLILLVVGVIILSFVWWVVKNYVPAEIQKWAILVVVLLCVLVLVNFVLSMGGHAFVRW